MTEHIELSSDPEYRRLFAELGRGHRAIIIAGIDGAVEYKHVR